MSGNPLTRDRCIPIIPRCHVLGGVDNVSDSALLTQIALQQKFKEMPVGDLSILGLMRKVPINDLLMSVPPGNLLVCFFLFWPKSVDLCRRQSDTQVPRKQ